MVGLLISEVQSDLSQGLNVCIAEVEHLLGKCVSVSVSVVY